MNVSHYYFHFGSNHSQHRYRTVKVGSGVIPADVSVHVAHKHTLFFPFVLIVIQPLLGAVLLLSLCCNTHKHTYSFCASVSVQHVVYGGDLDCVVIP